MPTTAMLIALLLQSGACSETRFQGPDGATLSVVVCPMLLPPADDAAPAEDAPAPKGKLQRS